MPFSETELNVKFNTKIKIYPNGATTTVCCSKPIFKDTAWEDRKKNINLNQVLPWYERAKNVPEIDEEPEEDEQDKQKRGESSGEPRNDSIKRAKDKCFDIAFCNSWDLFVTITFNPEKVDSLNASEVLKKLRVWLQDRVRCKGLKYLLIPEYHKSGRIHCHALMNDVLRLENSGKKLPDGRKIYNIPDWKYGFSTAIQCNGSAGNLAYYVTKYITKGNEKIFGKFFWSSKNIIRTPETVFDNMNYNDVKQKEFSVPCAGYGIKYDSYFGSFDEDREAELDDIMERVLNGEI